MNIQTLEKVKPSRFADWLLEHGIPAVTTKEAAALLGVEESQVRINLASSRRKGSLVSPARGLWVPVPLENRVAGHPDPMSYIDAMMRKLGRTYCVGWLSAAALHGAGHQAPQVFQVATDTQTPSRNVGTSRLEFLTRSRVAQMPSSIVTRSQGTARVADPATTIFMLAGDIMEAGGLDNASTVIVELSEDRPCIVDELCACADVFPLSAVRRTGWILDTFGEGVDTSALADHCAMREGATSLLSPHSQNSGPVSNRWKLCINRKVEPDL